MNLKTDEAVQTDWKEALSETVDELAGLLEDLLLPIVHQHETDEMAALVAEALADARYLVSLARYGLRPSEAALSAVLAVRERARESGPFLFGARHHPLSITS